MRKLVLILTLAVAVIGLLPVQSAVASEGTIVANTSSSWQTNGVVWALAYANGAVYLGGDFTSVRPPGAAAGVGEVARNRIAAFSATTGELLSFSHDVNARVVDIAPSPDGGRIYIGGDFATVDGQSRPRLAGFDTTSGALLSWAPRANAGVRGLAVHPDGQTVYVGGNFTTMNGTARTRLGAVTTNNGALLPWAPTADNTVYKLAVAPNGTRVFVGGYFSTLNNQSRRATGSLNPVTGANETWLSANVVPPKTSTCNSNIKDVVVDQSNVYFAAEGTGGGCFDGTFAARQSDGGLIWKNNCLGATQSVEVIGQFLYKGSHAHNCSASGGFPEVPDGQSRHLLAQRLGDGSLGPWYPNTSGNPLGPRAMATDGRQLFVGGDFLSVNNQPQQGFARFADAPDLTKPRKPSAPTGVSPSTGRITVTWQATTDDDDENLIYRLYRDGGSTPIYTSPAVRSTFWIKPTISFQDTVTPGTTHTYRVDAKEASGTNVSFKSNASAPVTAR